MTQISYHPAFDPYNSLLRLVRLLAWDRNGLDKIALRLLEFYLLFPERLIGVRLSPQLRSSVRKLNAAPRFPYDRLPTDRSVFERMRASSDAAIETLLSKGFARPESGTSKFVLRRDEVPSPLLDLAVEQNENEAALMGVLEALGGAFPTNGPNGLKDRSGLMEFRYDVV